MARSPVPAPAEPGARRRHGRRAGGGFALLLIVLAVALLIGSGALGGGGGGSGRRIAGLETQIKCPSCDDLSVAQSSSSTSLAVRRQIVRLVRHGDSDQQVEDALVDEYGPTILLAPPASGLSAAVYVLPAVAGAVAVGTLAALFWRRTRELARLGREQPEGDEPGGAGARPGGPSRSTGVTAGDR